MYRNVKGHKNTLSWVFLYLVYYYILFFSEIYWRFIQPDVRGVLPPIEYKDLRLKLRFMATDTTRSTYSTYGVFATYRGFIWFRCFHAVRNSSLFSPISMDVRIITCVPGIIRGHYYSSCSNKNYRSCASIYVLFVGSLQFVLGMLCIHNDTVYKMEALISYFTCKTYLTLYIDTGIY